MTERGDRATFWRRTCLVLGTLLALSVATICGLIAILVLRSHEHKLEMTALRAQNEQDREILTKMWQATDDALKREQQQTARAPSLEK